MKCVAGLHFCLSSLAHFGGTASVARRDAAWPFDLITPQGKLPMDVMKNVFSGKHVRILTDSGGGGGERQKFTDKMYLM